MNTIRHNPDSEESQRMQRENDRYIGGLKLAALYGATLADNEAPDGSLPCDGAGSIDAILERIAPTWRGMDTFPKDGSKVDCLRPGDRRHTAIATPQGPAWENGIHITDAHNIVAWRPAWPSDK